MKIKYSYHSYLSGFQRKKDKNLWPFVGTALAENKLEFVNKIELGGVNLNDDSLVPDSFAERRAA